MEVADWPPMLSPTVFCCVLSVPLPKVMQHRNFNPDAAQVHIDTLSSKKLQIGSGFMLWVHKRRCVDMIRFGRFEEIRGVLLSIEGTLDTSQYQEHIFAIMEAGILRIYEGLVVGSEESIEASCIKMKELCAAKMRRNTAFCVLCSVRGCFLTNTNAC